MVDVGETAVVVLYQPPFADVVDGGDENGGDRGDDEKGSLSMAFHAAYLGAKLSHEEYEIRAVVEEHKGVVRVRGQHEVVASLDWPTEDENVSGSAVVVDAHGHQRVTNMMGVVEPLSELGLENAFVIVSKI